MGTIPQTILTYICNLQKVPAPVLPDEDADAFLEFRHDLVVELVPTSKHLVRIACSLAEIEWELDRHRRLRAASVRTATRDGVEKQVNQFNTRLPNPKQMFPKEIMAITEGAVSDNVERRRQSAEALGEYGYSLSEFTAAAFRSEQAAVLYHDAKIANLEGRRRQVRGEYDALKARTGTAATSIEAEVVGQ